MAGLLAARVLHDAFRTVTVVERDQLTPESVHRRGVPQSPHVHALAVGGGSTLADLFPGFGEDLIRVGGLLIDLASDFRFFDEGDFVADGPHRIPWYSSSRPLVEQITRRRANGLDGVVVRDRCQFTDYLVDDATSTVSGVAVRNEDDTPEEIPGDLVVDATGRTSRTPTWLEDRGFPSPPVDEVHIDLSYSSILIGRPEDDRRAYLVMPSPTGKRGAGVFPIEGGRWLMTVAGVHGDHPPSGLEELADFVASLPTPEFRNIIDEHDVVSEEAVCYPFPSNRRHRYWDLDRFPQGLVVIGDAVASFNPIYGQGMSVAALEALHLHHALALDGTEDLPGRFFERIESVVANAWNLAVGSDFRHAETTGPKPSGTNLINWYFGRLTRRAHSDGTLANVQRRVVSMERDPSAIFRPGVLWRVLKPSVIH